MHRFLSKRGIQRGFLIGIGIFIWAVWLPYQKSHEETLFCYTRDAFGNKALMKDNGAIFVEDVFIMEIPKEEWEENRETTVTVILEDEFGHTKTKTLKIYENSIN